MRRVGFVLAFCAALLGLSSGEGKRFYKRTFQKIDLSPERVEKLLNSGVYFQKTPIREILELSDQEIRELIQPRATFYYSRCPRCGSHEVQGAELSVLSGWSLKDPFRIQCTKCKQWFPNEEYPENATLEIVGPTGKKQLYRYHRKPNGDMFFMTDTARQILNDTLCSATRVLAELWLLTKERKYAHKAAVIMDRFCEVWYEIPVHGDVGNDLFHKEFYSKPPYLGNQCTKIGRWKGDVIPLELVKAYDLLYESDEFERMSKEVGYDVRQRIERCFRDAVSLALREMYPIADHILRTAYCLGDPQMIHLGVRLFYETLRGGWEGGYCLDGQDPRGTGYHSPCGGYIKIVGGFVKGYSDPPGYVDLVDGKHFENLDIEGLNPKFCRYLSKRSAEARAKFRFPNGYVAAIHDAWSTSRRGGPPLKKSQSHLFAGFGHVILGRGEGKNQLQAHLHFSPLGVHGHNDMLNIIIFAKGHEFIPDFGYTHTLLRAWSSSTLGHNTVLIDRKEQYYRKDNHNLGNLLLYDASNAEIKVVEAEGLRAYDRIVEDLKDYRRLIALVAVSEEDAYVVDIFWVKGGHQHDWVIHTAGGPKGDEPQKIEVNLNMKRRPGTLLGKKKRFQDVKLWLDEVPEERDSEYGLIDNLRTASTDKTWRGEIRFLNDQSSSLRLTMLGGVESEVILGDAPNPRSANHDPNPPQAIYNSKTKILIVRRRASESTFAAVWEPYSVRPFIREVRALKVKCDVPGAFGMSITLSDGREDYILIGPKVDSELRAEGIKLVGRFGWIRKAKGKVERMYLLAGTELAAGSHKLRSTVPTGVLRNVKSYAGGDDEKCLIVEFSQKPPTAEDLKGRTILVSHPDASTHGYTIERIEEFEDAYKVYTEEDPGFRITYRNVAINEPTLPLTITEMLYFPVRKIEGGKNLFSILCAEAVAPEVCNAPKTKAPAVGPRHPVGPDVPLSKGEESEFAHRIAVHGFSAAHVQRAVNEAIKEGIKVVYLPPGTYEFSQTVFIKGAKGLTLLGAGSKTQIIWKRSGFMFLIEKSDSVRFTRMVLVGPDTTWRPGNRSDCPRFNGGSGHRIDHCEIYGFEWGPSFWRGAVGQVDHCTIHNNATTGMGYGVLVYGAKAVLICDNELWSCRHCVASNGANTHWTFRHNHIKHARDLRPGDNISCLDAHGGLKGGSFVIEYNLIENVKVAVGTWAGRGLIRKNVFKNVSHTAIYHTSKEGLRAAGNKFVDVRAEYRGIEEHAENVVIDGKRVKGPVREISFPELKEIGWEYAK